MAEVRRVTSWPWSSLRLRLSSSRRASEVSISSCSPSPVSKEHTLYPSLTFLMKDRSLPHHQRFDQVVKILVECPKAMKQCEENGMTPLHFAVLEGDVMCTKALIVFGADINALNHFDQTPLDIALDNQRAHQIVPLLISIRAEKGEVVKSRQSPLLSFSYPSPEEQVQAALVEEAASRPPDITNAAARSSNTASSQLSVLTEDSGRGCTVMGSMSNSEHFSELDSLTSMSEQYGHVLSLDGGGVRGLIQIEVLSEIERITGKKITEIFDWIIGTSTGAIIALLLVYKKKKLHKMRRTLFKINNIAKTRCSEELERLLKEEFGTEMKMSDVKHPKVLITAVSKASTQPKLHFFNNCFGDEFSTQLVWKVARCTSATPMYFTEFENYVDGGVLANNPCDEGLISIQSYYRQLGVQTPISSVTSISCGVYPSSDAVHFSSSEVSSSAYYSAGSRNHTNEYSFVLKSDAVADRCKEQCERYNVAFYRINPSLEGNIPTWKTETNKLIDVLVASKIWLCSQQWELSKLSCALGHNPLDTSGGTMDVPYTEGCRSLQ